MRKRSVPGRVLSAVLVLMCVSPFLYLFAGSFFDDAGRVTLRYYYQVFLATPQYLIRFWKSIAMSLCIAAGQTAFAALAGFGFAKCRFRGKNGLFFVLTVLMILPLQVTLIPNYMILSRMGLLDSYAALILPAVFVPLGTYLMTRTFRSVLNDVLEAARLDGCNTARMIVSVACPIGRNGLLCTFLLSFLDGWNMVEQPIVYLNRFTDYPLSVALASAPAEGKTIQLVCCVLSAIPPLLLFALLNRELAEGIVVGGEK